MKIVDIKTYIMESPGREYVFVKVQTDEGIHGWGEGTLEMKQGTVAAAVTSVEAGVASAPVVSFELEANRPFFFAIRDDRTGAILFMGAVHEPKTA